MGLPLKIGIVGNYGNNNNGDEAILLGLLNQLEKHFHVNRQDILVFSNNPEQTKERYQVQADSLYIKKKKAALTFLATFQKHRSTIKKLDLLIIGGGGILMDLYGREAILYGMYGWLGKLANRPVVVYGVGAGPILTKKGAMFIRSLAGLSKMVSVRDPKSKQLLQSIGVKKDIHIIGDPAFQMKEATKLHQDIPTNIGVTAVPYYHKSYWPEENKEKYENYVMGMAMNLDQILCTYPDVFVTFFATKHPQDMWVTKDIVERMSHKKNCQIIEEPLDPTEIVEQTAKQDLVIGTRLHSLILSLVSETPILAVSYHHKVRDFMEMIGRNEDVIDIETLADHPKFFFEAYRNMRENWSTHQSIYQDVAKQMKEKSLKGMPLVEKAIQ